MPVSPTRGGGRGRALPHGACPLAELADKFPQLKFIAAEYGTMEREVNDVVYGLREKRGLGTFNWEPTHETDGNAGHTLFSTSGSPRTATADLALYDEMKRSYADRL